MSVVPTFASDELHVNEHGRIVKLYTCRLCGSKIRDSEKSTGNFIKHVKRIHAKEYFEFAIKKNFESSQDNKVSDKLLKTANEIASMNSYNTGVLAALPFMNADSSMIMGYNKQINTMSKDKLNKLIVKRLIIGCGLPVHLTEMPQFKMFLREIGLVCCDLNRFDVARIILDEEKPECIPQPDHAISASKKPELESPVNSNGMKNVVIKRKTPSGTAFIIKNGVLSNIKVTSSSKLPEPAPKRVCLPKILKLEPVISSTPRVRVIKTAQITIDQTDTTTETSKQDDVDEHSESAGDDSSECNLKVSSSEEEND